MKKILLLFILFFLFLAPVTNAQTTDEDNILFDGPTPVPSSINYPLPYPGLVPGDPLYPLKKARDMVVEFFISDSQKKAEFYRLQADKNLSAAIILSERGNDSLAESSISKGENYLEKSLSNAIRAKQEQKSSQEVVGKLNLSSQKYQEVIKMISLKSSNENLKKLEHNLKRAEYIEKRVNKYRASNQY